MSGKKKQRNGNGNGAPPPRRRRQRQARRTRADKVLAQGVAAVPIAAAGSVPSYDLRVFDATAPQHLPLPRAIGPYLVVRTTSAVGSADDYMQFGAMRMTSSNAGANAGDWSNQFAVGSVAIGGLINAANNTHGWGYDVSTFSHGATWVPAAVTVQVMNATPLDTATGIMYAGVAKTQFGYQNSIATWQSVADNFVQFMSPRVLSAGKLVLRGVKMNSYPLNMSSLSEFTQMHNAATSSTFTWNDSYPNFEGMAPIIVFNPSGETLNYLVTTEWRLRFDVSSPASSAHTHHTPTPEHILGNLLRKATSLGNGVIDIADAVANAGQMAQRFAGSVLRPRGALAIADAIPLVD